MLADILPTGYEVGVLNGKVQPGDTVAVVGAGPVGLSAITGAKMYSPAHIVAIDLADARLEAAKGFGADVTVNNSREDAVAYVKGLTGGLGADVAIEAVGGTRQLRALHATGPPRWPRGEHRRAREAGHPPPGVPVDPRPHHHHRSRGHLLDAHPSPVGLLTPDAERFISHHFELGQMMEAYDVFARASETGALKVVLTR